MVVVHAGQLDSAVRPWLCAWSQSVCVILQTENDLTEMFLHAMDGAQNRQNEQQQNVKLSWTLFLVITAYYINTSEIPSELSLENVISAHVKMTCYLHTRRDGRRYGYIINRAS